MRRHSATAPPAHPQATVKDSLWKHEELTPGKEGVAGGDVAESPGQTLRPQAAGSFRDVAQDRDVGRKDASKIGQGVVAANWGGMRHGGCRRGRLVGSDSGCRCSAPQQACHTPNSDPGRGLQGVDA